MGIIVSFSGSPLNPRRGRVSLRWCVWRWRGGRRWGCLRGALICPIGRGSLLRHKGRSRGWNDQSLGYECVAGVSCWWEVWRGRGKHRFLRSSRGRGNCSGRVYRFRNRLSDTENSLFGSRCIQKTLAKEWKAKEWILVSRRISLLFSQWAGNARPTAVRIIVGRSFRPSLYMEIDHTRYWASIRSLFHLAGKF